jgi:hypothetical protein
MFRRFLVGASRFVLGALQPFGSPCVQACIRKFSSPLDEQHYFVRLLLPSALHARGLLIR